jgi:hypothetical protein
MPAALQLKKAEPQPSPTGLLRRQQIAPPAPHAKPNKVVQPKVSMPGPLAASQTPKITTPHMTAMARVKGVARATGVVQRAEVSASELKQMNPRFTVGLQASLNGVQIGNYISKSSKFGEDSEHDHAEDGILHALQSVVMTLELTGGKLAEGMGKAEVAIAQALTGNNVLLISNLTSSPCTTSTKVKKTSNKAAGEGCTEQLIELASKGLDLKIDAKTAKLNFKISVQADHYYQPGANGSERDLSKNASIDAVTRMKSAGIAVAVTKT